MSASDSCELCVQSELRTAEQPAFLGPERPAPVTDVFPDRPLREKVSGTSSTRKSTKKHRCQKQMVYTQNSLYCYRQDFKNVKN